MVAIDTRRIALLCIGLSLIGMFAGCNPRELTVSGTDRVYVPSPKEVAEQEGKKVTEAKAEPQGTKAEPPATSARKGTETAPPPSAREEEKGPAATSGTPLEEVRVAEPPIETPRVPQPPEQPPGGPSSGSSGSPAAPLVAQAGPSSEGGSPGTSASEGGAGSSGTPLEDVFFDYDRFLIRNDAKPILQANATVLKSEAKLKVLIEGHTDERGTSEYNLVLGEKRARAARQYLQDLGVEASRVEITSLGKEKPFCSEHNPTCWQKNRRAHFVVQ